MPLTVTPAALGAPFSFPVKAKARWLICENICVPEEGEFRLDLPVRAASIPSPQAPLFAAADERIPQPSPFAAKLSADGVLSLKGDGISPSSVRDAWFFPEKWDVIDDAAPQKLEVANGSLSLFLKPAKTFDPKASLPGVLVLRDESGAERFGSDVEAMPDLGPKPFRRVSIPAFRDEIGPILRRDRRDLCGLAIARVILPEPAIRR